ncbi:dipeptidyl-peptidase III [Microdochium nivale]|nr:dipeptidyl-peptidase III [Microdochium nivale]
MVVNLASGCAGLALVHSSSTSRPAHHLGYQPPASSLQSPVSIQPPLAVIGPPCSHFHLTTAAQTRDWACPSPRNHTASAAVTLPTFFILASAGSPPLPPSPPAATTSDSPPHDHGLSTPAALSPTIAKSTAHKPTPRPRYLPDGQGLDQEGPVTLLRARPPPPKYPYSGPSSEPSALASFSLASPQPAPPPLYQFGSAEDLADNNFSSPKPTDAAKLQAAASSPGAAPAYSSLDAEASSSQLSTAQQNVVVESKRALPQDTKGEPSDRKADEAPEPPPAYEESFSPLLSFTYVMAAAGGAASILTQVQQGGPPVNSIGDVGADETITMDLRGTRFVLSRDELLTLPEFVLLSLFPNGLFPEGHMGGFSEGDAIQVDYDPASLTYMLDFFRDVAQTIPNEISPTASPDGGVVPIDSLGGRGEDASKRAGIIVLREDLDFYAIPPRPDIGQAEMIEVKRAAARALLKQNGIFSGLKRSDEPGTTEAHLIEMLTAGGFNHDDRWGHRAGEPNKAVVCSLALARLRSDIRGNDMGSNAVGMAQKLLLFWRKPARRCWWEGVDLENVEGVDGPLKVWIRRVWTLEMSVIGLR